MFGPRHLGLLLRPGQANACLHLCAKLAFLPHGCTAYSCQRSARGKPVLSHFFGAKMPTVTTSGT
eukprot:360719-Chlamydomonas_euryale.AAC.9